MQLSDFPLLTDENIQSDVVNYLRNENYDVKDVKEEGLEGSGDEQLLKIAHQENRIILTHDRDFGRLIFTTSIEFIGIIYLRPGHFDPSFTINSWKSLTKAALDMAPPFIIVAENTGDTVKIRYRQL